MRPTFRVALAFIAAAATIAVGLPAAAQAVPVSAPVAVQQAATVVHQVAPSATVQVSAPRVDDGWGRRRFGFGRFGRFGRFGFPFFGGGFGFPFFGGGFGGFGGFGCEESLFTGQILCPID